MELDEGPKSDSVGSLFPADVERKVERILKLIKRRNRTKKDPELVGLVEDFYKQYQSLYALYDHLRQGSAEVADDGKGFEYRPYYASGPHYASGSESEYYSSDDIEINSEIAVNYNRSLHRRMPDNISEDLERAFAEVAELKHKLASRTEEKEALASDHLVALRKIKEIETINSDLRKEVDEKEKRVYALENAHKGQVTELEEQLAGLKTKLETLHHEKTDLEAQLDAQKSETKQQGETNKALYAQSSEFELIAKEEGDEVTKLMKQIEDKESSLTSKIEESMAQISNLKKEVDCLRPKKCEDGGSIACKSNESSDRENVIKQELESLRSQKTELEILLEKNSEEISQFLIQVNTLKGELATKSAVEQVMVEEKEGLLVQLMDLESQVDILQRQKNIAEDEVKCHIHEINQLREETHNMQARILELETLFQKRGFELSALHDGSESKRIKEIDSILTMNEEVELLQQKLDSLKMEKSQLESQIADQQRIVKEREESVNKSVEVSNAKLVRRWSSASGSKINVQVLERKMEDLAEEFRKKLEDNIRLLYQRIKVAEKIHFENKDTHNKIKERLELENVALKEKLAIDEVVVRKLRDTTYLGENALTILNSAENKIEDTESSLDDLVSENNSETERESDMKRINSNVGLLVAELDKENQVSLLSGKVSHLEAKLSGKREEKLKLMRAVNKLEQRVTEVERIMKEKDEALLGLQEEKREAIKVKDEALLGLQEEKREAIEAIKVKDEALLGLQEEKREAIRQLCLLIDYHRGRCDHLKEFISISKLTVRSKKKT